jgi:hypothetical protein
MRQLLPHRLIEAKQSFAQLPIGFYYIRVRIIFPFPTLVLPTLRAFPESKTILYRLRYFSEGLELVVLCTSTAYWIPSAIIPRRYLRRDIRVIFWGRLNP